MGMKVKEAKTRVVSGMIIRTRFAPPYEEISVKYRLL